jgi:ribosomal protein L11 methyltransferase
MPEGAATFVARLWTDAANARKIDDALTQCLDPDEVATSAFEEGDGRWLLTVHFRAPPDETAVRQLVAEAAGATAGSALTFETLAPTDWVRQSLAGLTPVEAGRFVVHGAHDRERVRNKCITIEIEASLAFGTGHHGTTRGCLIALDRIAKARRGRTFGRVLDVGTGSGVLAIAAAKALRQPVLASDIDRRSAGIARNNVRLNGASAFVEVVHAAGLGRFGCRRRFALILANILLEPLQRLATPMARLAAGNSRIVLSGLLTTQARPALASYRARGLVLVSRITLGGWATLVLARPMRRSTASRAVQRG